MIYNTVKPSKSNPVYSVHIVNIDGKTLNVHDIVTELKRSEPENQLAQKVIIGLMNVPDSCGRLIEDQISVLNTVFVYANDGERVDEVFRGIVWDKRYTNKNKRFLTLVCYDGLIYFQKTEESKFFEAGKQTSEVSQSLCADKGVSLIYKYESIEHPKLPLSGKLADIFRSDLLEEVYKKTRKKSVMYMDKGNVYIETVGQNETVPEIKRFENAISSESDLNMDDVITQVAFTGKTDDDERVPIEKTITGDTDTFGTIQKIIRKGIDEEEDKSEEDAEFLLYEYGKPKLKFSVEAIDNPFVRKGNKVKVVAGDMLNYYIVLSVSHDGINKTMTLTLELSESESEKLKSSDESIYSGKAVSLSYTPLYYASDSGEAVRYLSGMYYVYDAICFSGRYRITSDAALCGVKPINENVIGWVDKEHLTG